MIQVVEETGCFSVTERRRNGREVCLVQVEIHSTSPVTPAPHRDELLDAHAWQGRLAKEADAG